MNPTLANFYSGTSGLVLPFPKYKFPKEHESSSRLTYYASLFNSIEVNSSFYKLPMARTVAKWSGEVPVDFRFTFKVWREITHVKNLIFNKDDVSEFFKVVNHIGDKKGCLLFQFPPGLKSRDFGQLEKLMDAVEASDHSKNWQWALEFRDPSWYADEVRQLAESYHATIVIHDKKGSVTPSIISSGKTIYVRFHGPEASYRGTYTDEFLSEYAGYVINWLTEGKDVFVYFNNTLGGVLENLNTLNNYVTRPPDL